MGIKFNITYWPIVYFKLIGNINDENFEEYKVNYLNLLINCKKKRDKIILIPDLNSNYEMPMKYIFKLALFNKKLFKFNKLYLRAVCIFSQSKSFKNLLKIYLSLITPSSPYKLCSCFDKINIFLKNNLNIDFDTNIFNLNEQNQNQNNIDNSVKIKNNNNEDNDNDNNNNINIIKSDLYKKLNEEEINEEINDFKI